jgi:hypothetical protein
MGLRGVLIILVILHATDAGRAGTLKPVTEKVPDGAHYRGIQASIL